MGSLLELRKVNEEYKVGEKTTTCCQAKTSASTPYGLILEPTVHSLSDDCLS